MSVVRTDQQAHSTQAAWAWILTVITLGYFLPWAIAATRGKSNSGAIAIVNLLAGWTVIGWIIALVMACMAHQVVGVTPGVPQLGYAQPLALPSSAAAPAGWYPQADGHHRWWDGAQWTEYRA